MPLPVKIIYWIIFTGVILIGVAVLLRFLIDKKARRSEHNANSQQEIKIMDDHVGLQWKTPDGKNVNSTIQTTGIVDVDYEGNVLLPGQTIPAINVSIDKRLEKHVNAIAKRKEVVSTEILKLAQELCSLAMYVERPTVIVENCKFAVEFTKSDAYYLRIYLKDIGKGDADKLTWKDIISKVSSEPSMLKTRQVEDQTRNQKKPPLGVQVLIDDIRGRKKQRIQPTLASITLNTHWMITNDALPLSMIRLLPAARMLVKEQLALMYDAAQDDIEYIQQWPSDDDELSSEIKEA